MAIHTREPASDPRRRALQLEMKGFQAFPTMPEQPVIMLFLGAAVHKTIALRSSLRTKLKVRVVSMHDAECTEQAPVPRQCGSLFFSAQSGAALVDRCPTTPWVSSERPKLRKELRSSAETQVSIFRYPRWSRSMR